MGESLLVDTQPVRRRSLFFADTGNDTGIDTNKIPVHRPTQRVVIRK